MRKQWHTWVIFGVCLVMVLGAMGWISATVLRLDDREAAAKEAAAREESVRLARWRLEARLVDLRRDLGQRLEGARTALAAQAADARARSTKGGKGGTLEGDSRRAGEWDQPLEQGSPADFVTSRREVLSVWWLNPTTGDYESTRGTAKSQPGIAPAQPGAPLDLSVSAEPPITPALLTRWRNRIATGFRPGVATATAATKTANNDTVPQIDAPLPAPAPYAQSSAHAETDDDSGIDEQTLRNHLENRALRDFVEAAVAQRALPQLDWEDTQLCVWQDGEARISGRSLIIGAWLDPAAVSADLEAAVHDLLPNAKIRAAPSPGSATPAAPTDVALIAAPLILEPGRVAFYYQRPYSPIRLMLLIAWSGMLLPAVGVAILLVAMSALSERRAAFVSAVTHELRTPLTTFRMYTDMLAEGMIPPDAQAEYLRTLQRESQRLTHLVDNVLTYARLERGRAHEALQPVAIVELLDRVVDTLRERAIRADMDLRLDRPSDEVATCAVLVDPGAVERILMNLVDNACKYAVGGPDRSIHLYATVEGEYATLCVRDHGPGIPASAAHLFRPFHRLDDATRGQPGLGLGLALSRRLAERMGGRLDLQRTATNTGTTPSDTAVAGATFILHLRTVSA